MSEEVDDLVLRLAQVQDALATLPDGPSPERFELLTEQDTLRARARVFQGHRDRDRSLPELEDELASLKSQRKHLISDRTGYATSKGGNNAGPASGAWVALGKSSLSSSGLDRINIRINQIEDELKSRS
ncbi:MAG: hypothetical protein WBM90_05570 [Acidimicrobiia bacterium]